MQPMDFVLAVIELVVMVFSLSLHDCAQAWMANRLGDPTARMNGRLTMNPLRHYDVLGTLLFPVIYVLRSPPFVMGWSKPVPMTARNFRQPKRDETLALAAGPAAQLIAAAVALIALVVVKHVSAGGGLALVVASQVTRHGSSVPVDGLPPFFPVVLLLYFLIFVNLLLFVFNLVPFPFFDGGKILMNYLPYNAAQIFQQYSMWFMIAFFFLGFGIVLAFFAPLMALFDALLFAL